MLIWKFGPGSDGLTRISADPSFLMDCVLLHTGDFPLSRVDFASFLVSLLCLCEVSGHASTIDTNLRLIRATGARHLWQMSISSRSAGSVSTGAVTGLSVCVCKRERVYYGSGSVLVPWSSPSPHTSVSDTSCRPPPRLWDQEPTYPATPLSSVSTHICYAWATPPLTDSPLFLWPVGGRSHSLG